jgi:hypothetical protein
MASPPDRATIVTTAILTDIVAALRDFLFYGQPVTAVRLKIESRLRDEFAEVEQQVAANRDEFDTELAVDPLPRTIRLEPCDRYPGSSACVAIIERGECGRSQMRCLACGGVSPMPPPTFFDDFIKSQINQFLRVSQDRAGR